MNGDAVGKGDNFHEDVLLEKGRVVIVRGRGVGGDGSGEGNVPIEGDANGGRGAIAFLDNYIKLRPGDLKVTAGRSLILNTF